MNKYVLDFNDIDKHMLADVGGKGANLGELSKIEGIYVPDGFCVTTKAYKKALDANGDLNDLLERLCELGVDESESIKALSLSIRENIENISIPVDIAEEIDSHLMKLGENGSYAVRSSATAEDLPGASFAGQQDTYLNIHGKEAILKHIVKCWASLFTERAVVYRIKNDFDHRKVYLSVVIERMVFPEASGIMFTADPITSNRNALTIDAGFGLGEALVSGKVSADNYTVQNGEITKKKISIKNAAIHAKHGGGTEIREIDAENMQKQVLSDDDILQLEKLGRKIEHHFACPQDIEWGLYDGKFVVLQSRPITTLYPIPEVTDGKNHVYASSGHMQMMTDPIKPLGMFFFRVIIGEPPSREAGGRLYLDISHDLASPIGRQMALLSLKMVGENLMLNAVSGLLKRKGFAKSLARGRKKVFSASSGEVSLGFIFHFIKMQRKNDPKLVRNIIFKDGYVVQSLKKEIVGLSGKKLFEFIENDLCKLKKTVITAESTGALTVAVFAVNWVNKKMEKWLGEKNVADTLTQSVPNSITADTGFALLDVADAVRECPEAVEYFKKNPSDQTYFQDLAELDGGGTVIEAMRAYLDSYGMRCSGDIDITKPRWIEQPTSLISIILSNIENFPPNSREFKIDSGLKESERREKALLSRLMSLPGGKRKAAKAEKMIRLMRNHIGFREYPKFAFVRRYQIYKEALLNEAETLVRKGLIREKEDVYYLYYEEFRDAVITGHLDYSIICKRKEDYKLYEKLNPPRIMTTEDGIISAAYGEFNISEEALPGIPVSSGTVEGRARVVMKMENAKINDGDILVTSFTDPSWTPVFVSLKGLVTEVGGLMTHGAVIAREYGLPAVVSVENATKLIKDGDLIRVNGTQGYVEILS